MRGGFLAAKRNKEKIDAGFGRKKAQKAQKMRMDLDGKETCFYAMKILIQNHCELASW